MTFTIEHSTKIRFSKNKCCANSKIVILRSTTANLNKDVFQHNIVLVICTTRLTKWIFTASARRQGRIELSHRSLRSTYSFKRSTICNAQCFILNSEVKFVY